MGLRLWCLITVGASVELTVYMQDIWGMPPERFGLFHLINTGTCTEGMVLLDNLHSILTDTGFLMYASVLD